MAARTAATSRAIPLAKDATRLPRQRSIQGTRSYLYCAPDHLVEPLDDGTRLNERRYAGLYRSNRHSFCPGQGSASGRHQPGDGSCRRHAVEELRIDPLSLSSPARPFGYDP